MQQNRAFRQHMHNEVLRELGMLDREILRQPEFKQPTTAKGTHLRNVTWGEMCPQTLARLTKLNKPSAQEQPATSLVAPVDSINAHARGLVLHRAGWKRDAQNDEKTGSHVPPCLLI